ncbi:MAG: arginyltransferase [Pseudomonadota bacterium]
MKIGDSHLFPAGYRRALRFYMTRLAPCPYLDGHRERKAFTNIDAPDADHLHDILSRSGFRRSQSIAYRPACPNCNACRSVRVNARDFRFTKGWRRILNRNSDVQSRPVAAEATREQYRLLRAYLRSRHNGGGMSEMSFRDYAAMVDDSPVQSLIFEYRAGREPDAPLVAAAITDVLRDGLSMVYTFFDAKDERRSLGSYIILDHVAKAAELGLPHVYLGYWVKGSPKMDYKRRFDPLEVLDGDIWRPMTEDD